MLLKRILAVVTVILLVVAIILVKKKAKMQNPNKAKHLEIKK